MEDEHERGATQPASRLATGLPFDLRGLRFVLAAADNLSFTRAAEALHSQVSSVSRGVRDFEDQIGVALFERSSVGIRPTDAGAHFLGEIVPALRQVEAALHRASAAGRGERGKVRIGLSAALAGGPLRNLVKAFRQSHTRLDLEIHDGAWQDHLRALRTRALDIAFFCGSTTSTDLDTLQLWQERVYVAMGQNHVLGKRSAIDWMDLRKERFIVQESAPEIRDHILYRLGDSGIPPNIVVQTVTPETLLHMVAIGEGLTLVLDGWRKVIFPDLILRPLEGSEETMPISAAWSSRNDNPALRRFISFARTEASRHQWQSSV